MKRLLQSLVIGALCMSGDDVAAEKYYKWTDANGVVQYSTTPPPKDAAQTKEVSVSRAPTPVPATEPVATAVTGTEAAAAAGNTDIKAENERRQREYKQKMCAYAQQQLAESQQRGPRRVVETRGSERSVALPAERAAERAKWQTEAGKHCG